MTIHLNKGQEEMKVQTISKLIALSLIAATTLQATNGDNLIGVGAKARGMGGTGIAVAHGAESGLANAALITSVEGTEISFGGILFMPTIKTSITSAIPAFAATGVEYQSDAEVNMIPEVSIAHKINDNWYIGIGMWGTAGMGTDYSKQAGNFNMVTNLQLLQFGVPIAYKTGGLSLAVTPVLQYGNLDINYNSPLGAVGSGLAQDFGFGYNLGMAYDFSNGLTFGATYKSSIEMNYNGQITTAIGAFGAFGVTLPVTDTLEQPAEFGIGFAYEMGQHTFAFDYKKIKWADTKGYGDFGWEDQNVYAFGYQFAQNNWAVRVGYNRADSAVVENAAGATTPNGAALNFFNLLGFPANAESHYTLGGTYDISNAFSVDLAYVYSPETTDTFSLAGFGAPGSISTSHQESSLAFQLNYTF
jgi:long-chain fatty acid transport protein